MRLFTIGFTRKSAERFFTLLANAGVRRVFDVRLNNTSQLAGFSKHPDLAYLLHATHGIGYEHLTPFAPTAALLTAFKKQNGDWATYEAAYRALLDARQVAAWPDRTPFDHACLLCSEHSPTQCHRRVAAEFLAQKWGSIEIVHLQ